MIPSLLMCLILIWDIGSWLKRVGAAGARWGTATPWAWRRRATPGERDNAWGQATILYVLLFPRSAWQLLEAQYTALPLEQKRAVHRHFRLLQVTDMLPCLGFRGFCWVYGFGRSYG